MGMENFALAVRNYRVVWIAGRYGGGKTALAFRLAHELMQRFDFRYVLSNVRSVWNTNPDKVLLRNGYSVDAVMVLDEGGMFLDSPQMAKEWLAYLRKLNIVLIVPSVIAPSLLMRRCTVQRTGNLQMFGIPAWRFEWALSNGLVQQKSSFWWYGFSEIFGIYDTLGMPSEAGDLLQYVAFWTRAAGVSLNYNARIKSNREPSSSFEIHQPHMQLDIDAVEENTESMQMHQELMRQQMEASMTKRRKRGVFV